MSKVTTNNQGYLMLLDAIYFAGNVSATSPKTVSTGEVRMLRP